MSRGGRTTRQPDTEAAGVRELEALVTAVMDDPAKANARQLVLAALSQVRNDARQRSSSAFRLPNSVLFSAACLHVIDFRSARQLAEDFRAPLAAHKVGPRAFERFLANVREAHGELEYKRHVEIYGDQAVGTLARDPASVAQIASQRLLGLVTQMLPKFGDASATERHTILRAVESLEALVTAESKARLQDAQTRKLEQGLRLLVAEAEKTGKGEVPLARLKGLVDDLMGLKAPEPEVAA